jgi:hypothetical protein
MNGEGEECTQAIGRKGRGKKEITRKTKRYVDE